VQILTHLETPVLPILSALVSRVCRSNAAERSCAMKLLAATRLPPFGLDSSAGQMNLGLERITSPTDLVGTMLLEMKSPLADLQPIRSIGASNSTATLHVDR
jgi:hypothetical protein